MTDVDSRPLPDVLTLALLLFSDASTVRLGDVEGDAGLPRRLLFVGLPLTVLAGALLAYFMFPKVGWAAAALVATILAPTDAALGLAVVTNKAVPVPESGHSTSRAVSTMGSRRHWSPSSSPRPRPRNLSAIRHGGSKRSRKSGWPSSPRVVVGYLGGKLLAFASERGWTSGVSEQIAILALALLLAYGGAVAIGGNGFIAGFAGGILFGAATRGRMAEPVEFTETLGLSASFLVWSIFGALFVGNLLTHQLSVQPIVYVILSLTVIRMVPVAIALTGTHLRPATVAFMGWFGPRGLASVVFTLLALAEIEHDGTGGMLLQTVTWTILLSVVLHGISAPPLAARYGASIAKAGKIPEKAPAGEPRVRLHDLAGRHRLRGQQARETT